MRVMRFVCAAHSAAAVPAGAPVVETAIADARLPNGMTWAADGRTMFWIDTFLNRVDAFDFDAHAGALSNRRTVVKCPRQGASVHGAVGGAAARYMQHGHYLCVLSWRAPVRPQASPTA